MLSPNLKLNSAGSFQAHGKMAKLFNQQFTSVFTKENLENLPDLEVKLSNYVPSLTEIEVRTE